jgi:hypothetical protein
MSDFTREKSAALCWFLLFILMVGSAVYDRTQNPRPPVVAMK